MNLDKISSEVNFASRYQDLKLLKRRWFPLWKLDGYILREFLIKYSILLLVFVILFILSDVYRDISDFLDAGTPWRQTLLYFAYRLPGNIRFILPIATLLGCMWTMATFGKNMEVTAMRASGVSLFRCGWSIFFVGLCACALNVYFNEELVPWTGNAADRLFDEAADQRRYSHSLLTYRSDDGKRRWLFQLFTGGSSYHNLTLKSVWSASLIDKLIGNPEEPGYQKRFRAVFTSRADSLLKLPAAERRSRVEELLIGRKVDFNVKEARYLLKEKQWLFDEGSFVSYDRIDESRFRSSSGTSEMHPDIAFTSLTLDRQEIPESPEDILNAIKEKDDLSTPLIWHVLHHNRNLPPRVRCIYASVFFYRLAFPWASFLAVFLGIPLATKNERTGSMLAIISAIALIVIYIVIAQTFLMLGKSGVIPPAAAGLTPTIAFIIAGAIRLLTDRN